jgi:tight adherence protein B
MLPAIFALITLAVYLFMSLVELSSQESVQQRLNRLVRQRKGLRSWVTANLPGRPLGPDPEEEARNPIPSAKEALVGLVEKATSGKRFESRLALRLQRGGWRWRPAEFLVAQGISAGIGLGVALISSPRLVWLFPLLGWAAPSLLLARSEKARLKAFEQQLPDALAIIANALRSGYSFLQAMEVVSREMPDPIAREFGLVLRENRVNIPLDESLQHMVERVKSPDLDLVVTAVLIQRQVGGNLSEVLDKIAGTIKDRIRLQGEIRTLTTQGRMSGWIISLLPIALAVLMQLVSPGYLDPMLSHPVGWLLMGLGVVMQGIGVLTIKKMVNLEV